MYTLAGSPALQRTRGGGRDRQLLLSADFSTQRVRPTIENGCSTRLKNITISYTSQDGSTRTLRGPRTLVARGKRRIGVRVSVPSEVTISGAVEGGAAFQLTFDADKDGQLVLTGGGSGGGAVGRVEGAPCTATTAAAALQEAAPAGTKPAPLTGAAKAAAQAAADAELAAASLDPTTTLDGGPNLGAYDRVQTAPAFPAGASQLIAFADKVIAYRNEPVDIYILANDRLRDATNTTVTLFDASSSSQLELLSIVDSGGETGESVFQRVNPNDDALTEHPGGSGWAAC
ncbi:hypothetical protein MNEG_15622 [Monoraphidium neglectum]|uniref:Uncharacterized protein n=1 Tax=Monoraphidium neglectum TaxID=145388 RepID=A0A0D2MAE0_9CHLO|nr:hypothetical protein MNEG_15622 [Monoraphidium neglectum]KIY92340.1 hypothetical protein MNEG_15622 [Monoraphidium neglectum]|eukprot:XP_013891360.1 hypothetical protein MNEG_15622 [Monoraphidium neglectum]